MHTGIASLTNPSSPKSIRFLPNTIKSIYEDGGLLPEATIRHYQIVQTEGARPVGRQAGRTLQLGHGIIIYENGKIVEKHPDKNA